MIRPLHVYPRTGRHNGELTAVDSASPEHDGRPGKAVIDHLLHVQRVCKSVTLLPTSRGSRCCPCFDIIFVIAKNELGVAVNLTPLGVSTGPCPAAMGIPNASRAAAPSRPRQSHQRSNSVDGEGCRWLVKCAGSATPRDTTRTAPVHDHPRRGDGAISPGTGMSLRAWTAPARARLIEEVFIRATDLAFSDPSQQAMVGGTARRRPAPDHLCHARRIRRGDNDRCQTSTGEILQFKVPS